MATLTINALIAAIEEAKAAGQITGSTPVVVADYEGDKRNYVCLTTEEMMIAPVGETAEPSLIFDFGG